MKPEPKPVSLYRDDRQEEDFDDPAIGHRRATRSGGSVHGAEGAESGACCKTLDIPERMLGRMFGAEDGVVDRLEFTRAVSGASFFVPSLDTLRGLA